MIRTKKKIKILVSTNCKRQLKITKISFYGLWTDLILFSCYVVKRISQILFKSHKNKIK